VSAFGQSRPEAATCPWRRVREKYKAQRIAMESGLPWTIMEPTWFMESLPLFVKRKTFSSIKGSKLKPYWISGDDVARLISTALKKNTGAEERIPAQGMNALPLLEAGKKFIMACDPSIKVKEVSLWIIKSAGVFSPRSKDFAALMKLSNLFEEPAPDQKGWERYGPPRMTIEDYAGYVKNTGDFPRKQFFPGDFFKAEKVFFGWKYNPCQENSCIH
jgi:hypothetical protein